MRILIVLPHLEIGGAERLNIELAQAFRQQGIETDIFLLQRQGDLLESATAYGIPCWGAQKWPQSAAYLCHYARRYDLLVAGLESLSTIIAAVAGLGARKPVVAEVHIPLDSWQSTLSGHSRLYPLLLERLYPHLAATIAVDAAVADALGERISKAGKLHIIPVGVNFTRITHAAQQPSIISLPTIPYIVAIGRLHSQKGFERLIRSHALAREQISHRLLIIGEGDQRHILEQLCNQLEVTDSVFLPGSTVNPYPALANAALYCMTSYYEGQPQVLLEALGLGIPALAMEAPGGIERVLARGKFGNITAANDIAYAAAIVNHLQQPQILRDAAQAAAAQLRQTSSLKLMADKYIKVFNSALDQ